MVRQCLTGGILASRRQPISFLVVQSPCGYTHPVDQFVARVILPEVLPESQIQLIAMHHLDGLRSVRTN